MIAKGLCLALLLVCSFARQPAPGVTRISSDKEQVDQELYREILSPYELHYLQYDESPKVYVARGDVFSLSSAPDDLLSKEIALLKRWEAGPDYSLDYNREPSLLLARLFGLGSYPIYSNLPIPETADTDILGISKEKPTASKDSIEKETKKHEGAQVDGKSEEEIELQILQKEDKNKKFALTPLDEGYFDVTDIAGQSEEVIAERGKKELLKPRKIRQNPNLSRAKNLVADDLDDLRLGFTDKDTGSTTRPKHIHVIESATPPQTPSFIYSSALLAAVLVALSMAVVGFVFGWFTILYLPSLSKKANAAAEDYPAYGVTGPTVDPSGDRNLAHSAHMYHYQHQKQQILAMESCLGRNGSVSEPDSEEENEEGDYTVYECPGFATTGNMEVKNPLFGDEPTPATPGKLEVIQPQPKE